MDHQKEISKGLRFLRKDPKMAPLIKTMERPSFRRRRKPFESLLQSIIFQQLAGAAASTIHRRFLAIYDGKPTPEKILATHPSKLRRCGLSKQKISYLKDLSRKVLNNTVEIKRLGHLSDEKIIEELVKVRGIGRWTAEMFLMFTMGRLDVFPVDDLIVRNGFIELYGLDKKISRKDLDALSERWKPYRSLGSWYMWMQADLKKKTDGLW